MSFFGGLGGQPGWAGRQKVGVGVQPGQGKAGRRAGGQEGRRAGRHEGRCDRRHSCDCSLAPHLHLASHTLLLQHQPDSQSASQPASISDQCVRLHLRAPRMCVRAVAEEVGGRWLCGWTSSGSFNYKYSGPLCGRKARLVLLC